MLALEGDQSLSGSSSKANSRGPRSGASDKKPRRDRAGTVGKALRTVYDETLREDIPNEFRDLLRKLD